MQRTHRCVPGTQGTPGSLSPESGKVRGASPSESEFELPRLPRACRRKKEARKIMTDA